MAIRFCKGCGIELQNRSLVNFCTNDCKLAMIKRRQNKPLDESDLQILKLVWHENVKRSFILEHYKVTSDWLTELVKRARAQLSGKQITDVYLKGWCEL